MNDPKRSGKAARVIAEVQRRTRQGRPVNPQRIIARYPDCAEELQKYFRQLHPHAADSNSRRGTIPPSAGDSVPAPGGAHDQLPATLGRYRLKQILGQGAMGAVYLANDTQLGRDVALKTPKLDDDTKEDVGRRFQTEARSAAALHHRNICPVFDVGEIDGVTFLTMAFIDGTPLSQLVAPDRPAPQKLTVRLIRKIAQGLSEAHRHGVIHRDLKPANIMVDQSREPVVMDFGLARQLENNEHSRLTNAGTIMGSPAYMSPEQVSGDPDAVGPASDIYSLGVILFEMLTGRLPYEGSVVAILGQIISADTAPDCRHFQPDVDAGLAEICQRMMAPQPEHRFTSMAEVAEALTQWQRSAESRAASGSSHGHLSQVSFPGLTPNTTTMPSTRRRRSAPAVRAMAYWKVVTSLLLISCLSVWLLLVRPGASPEVAHSRSVETNGDSESPAQTSGVTVLDIRPDRETTETETMKVVSHRAPNRLASVSHGGPWTIDGDELLLRDSTGQQVIQFGSPDWTDYDYSFEVNMKHLTRFTVLFRSTNTGSRPSQGKSHVWGSGWRLGNVLETWSWRSGTRRDDIRQIETERRESPIRHNTWQKIVTSVRGDHVTATIDGAVIFDAAGLTIDRGRVGFRTFDVHGGREVRIRNILVRSLDGRELWRGLPELPDDGRQPVVSGPGNTSVAPRTPEFTNPKPPASPAPTVDTSASVASLPAQEESMQWLTNWVPAGSRSNQRWTRTNRVALIDGPDATSFLWSPVEHSDYELSLEYRLGPNADAGVILRSPAQSKAEGVGVEVMLGSDGDARTSDGQPANGGLWFAAASAGSQFLAASRDVYRSGEWNRLTIVDSASSLRITLNGELLQQRTWTSIAYRFPQFRSRILRPTGYIGLQGWRGRVEYRNVRIRDLNREEPAAEEQQQPKPSDGSVSLFNGQDLSGWKEVFSRGAWSVDQEGVLVSQPRDMSASRKRGEKAGWIATQKHFQHFELEFDYWLSRDGNSGVFLRSAPQLPENGGNQLEVQLQDDSSPRFRNFSANHQCTGAVFGVANVLQRPDVPPEQWHHMQIRFVKNQLTVTVNSQLISDVDLRGAKKHDQPLTVRRKGAIGFQWLNGSARFRDIRIRRLTSDGRLIRE